MLILNADGTRAAKRSNSNGALEEFAHANSHECNFANLIALLCAELKVPIQIGGDHYYENTFSVLTGHT